MWEYEHSVETAASAGAVWELWTDVLAWPEWNAGVVKVEIEGEFARGTGFTMVMPDGDVIRMALTEVVPGELFVDEMDGGDFVVRTEHRLAAGAGGRTRVVYRTEISGPAADVVGPELGPAITADFPDVLAALVERAERGE